MWLRKEAELFVGELWKELGQLDAVLDELMHAQCPKFTAAFVTATEHMQDPRFTACLREMEGKDLKQQSDLVLSNSQEMQQIYDECVAAGRCTDSVFWAKWKYFKIVSADSPIADKPETNNYDANISVDPTDWE